MAAVERDPTNQNRGHSSPDLRPSADPHAYAYAHLAEARSGLGTPVDFTAVIITQELENPRGSRLLASQSHRCRHLSPDLTLLTSIMALLHSGVTSPT